MLSTAYFHVLSLIDESVPACYKHVKKMLAAQKEAHDDVTEELPSNEVARWERESIEAVKRPDKRWTSPLMDPVFDGKYCLIRFSATL